MKKLLTVIVAIAVLFSAAALADDLSALTDEELYKLYQDVEEEIARRNLPAGPETDGEANEVTQCVYEFFCYWSSNDLDNMLTLCDSGWKARSADPRTELFRILANRTPLNMEIQSAGAIAGESPDGLQYYLVTVVTLLDRNNGKAPLKYLLRLLVKKESDGLWRVDPTSLEPDEETKAAFPAEAAAAPETVLYYSPAGGEYYHADRNCRRVNPAFLPLQGSFLYSELSEEPYRSLKPCEICGAPAAPETDPFRFGSFREALDAADGEYSLYSEYAAALIEQDGRYFRAVAFLDEHAKELYDAYRKTWETESGKGVSDEGAALYAYLVTLPVQYTEEVFVVPFAREELDAMAGKTVGEIMSEPWEMQIRNYPEDAEAGKDVVFPMVKGFCSYELVINEPFEVYRERRAADRYDPVTVMSLKNYEDLTVKCVNYTGVSRNTLDLRYKPDGTFERDTEPE